MGSKMLAEEIAKVCFESIKSYCETINDGIEHKPWAQAPDWVKECFVRGVKFYLANPAATEEDCHDDWLLDRRTRGWKWGPKKIVALKESPYITTYDKLPEEQKIKNKLFLAIVEALC